MSVRLPQIEVVPAEVHDRGELGVQVKYAFGNNYGASVISGPFTYGGPDLWEVAVLGPDGRLCYSTPVADDVLGYLTDDDVARVLAQIAALPPVSAS